RRRDPDDRVLVHQDLRIRDVLDLDRVAAGPDGRTHQDLPPAFASSLSCSGWAGRWNSWRFRSGPSGAASERTISPTSISSLTCASCTLTTTTEVIVALSLPRSFLTLSNALASSPRCAMSPAARDQRTGVGGLNAKMPCAAVNSCTPIARWIARAFGRSCTPI